MIKKSKYGNKKTPRIINGEKVMFDSKREAKRYDELYILLKANRIQELTLQPKYELIPTIKWNGITLRKISYVADFRYIKNGVVIVEDSKGFKTPDYKLKMRLFILQNPKIKFIET